MKYNKPPLTFEEQVGLLIRRGLITNKDILIDRLKSVSYYRLSGYWYPFKNPDGTFKPETKLDTVWQRYIFDRQLRLLVLDGIERVEISIRTSLIYHFSHTYGPFGYIEEANLPNLDNEKFDKFKEQFFEDQKRSKEIFAKHFRRKYGDCHENLPLWMAVEVTTLGKLLTLFRGLDSSLKKKIAAKYEISDIVLESWFRALNGVRNICAHHGRLWNREFGYKPMIPKERKHPQWHQPIEIENNRVFAILTIIKYMLNIIAPQSDWPKRLNKLLDEYSEIPRKSMGFPDNWQDCPIWNEASDE